MDDLIEVFYKIKKCMLYYIFCNLGLFKRRPKKNYW